MHGAIISVIVFNFLALTFWAVWPPPLLLTLWCIAALIVYYVMIIHERRVIRRVLYSGKEQ
jgi:hypothetical protein